MDVLRKCLTCEKPSCTNCQDRYGGASPGRPSKYTPDKMAQYLRSSYSAARISQIEGVSVRTVRRWGKRYYLERKGIDQHAG